MTLFFLLWAQYSCAYFLFFSGVLAMELIYLCINFDLSRPQAFLNIN